MTDAELSEALAEVCELINDELEDEVHLDANGAMQYPDSVSVESDFTAAILPEVTGCLLVRHFPPNTADAPVRFRWKAQLYIVSRLKGGDYDLTYDIEERL